MNRRGPYYWNLLKGADYFAATVFGIPAGIYISGYVAYKKYDSGLKQPWVFIETAIDFLFRRKGHCTMSMRNNLEDIKYYYGG